MNLATLLAVLPAIGPAAAALPEFKKLFDAVVATFDNDRDQDEAKRAYELALRDAKDAHDELEAIVNRNRTD